MDETYIKVKGQWVYLYRTVDKQGRTVDFLLSQRRDVATAKRFFSHATRRHGAPRVITLDGYAASLRAVAQLKEVGTLPRRVRIRSSQYLNNVVEQDHRRIKQRIRLAQHRLSRPLSASGFSRSRFQHPDYVTLEFLVESLSDFRRRNSLWADERLPGAREFVRP
jgi:transposase-like protein